MYKRIKIHCPKSKFDMNVTILIILTITEVALIAFLVMSNLKDRENWE